MFFLSTFYTLKYLIEPENNFIQVSNLFSDTLFVWYKINNINLPEDPLLVPGVDYYSNANHIKLNIYVKNIS